MSSGPDQESQRRHQVNHDLGQEVGDKPLIAVDNDEHNANWLRILAKAREEGAPSGDAPPLPPLPADK